MRGSIIVSRYCDGLERPVGVFGVVLGLVGASAICVMALSSALFGPLTALDPRVAGMLQFVLLLLVPTTFSGMTFALVAKVYARSPKRFANDTGLLYALNTLGSIFGAVLGGFVILPLVGAQQGIVLVALLNVIVGVVILMRERPRWLTSLRLITAAVVFVLLAIPAFRADQIALASLMDKNDQLLFFRDGSESSIGVVEIPSDGDRYILVDGDQQAVTTVSGHFSLRLLGHLPPLFSRERSKGLIIAFGTGVTVANLLQHNLQQLDIVELSPIVIDVADYFSEWNKNALRDPRVRVIRDDGRNHLLTTESSYDVISVDPIDPDDAGVTSLYSHEFYELVHARLNPGGVAAQWIPTVYSAADFKMLLRTFQAVFPQSSLWIADFTVVLIGVKGEGKPDWTEMQQLFSRGQVEESFNRVGIDSLETLFAHQLLGPTELANYLGPGPLNTDQFPRIEYSGPRNFRFNNWPLVHLPPMHAEGSPDISQWVSGITDLGRVQQVQADMREVLTHYERRSFPWQSGDWEKVGAIHVGAVAGFDNYQNGLRSLYQMLLKQTSGAVLLQMELLSSRGPTPRYAYWREQIAALLAVGPNSDLVCAPQIGRSLVDDFYQLAYCDLIDQPLSSLEHLLQSQLARKYRESVTWFARMMLLRALDLSQQHGSYEQDRERLNALLPAELSLPVDLDRASEGLKQSLQRLVVKDMKIELL